jgi:hypothetical protein
MFKPEDYIDSINDLLDDEQTLVAENIVKSPLDMQERYMSLVPDELLDFIVKQWRPGMTSDQADQIFRKYSTFKEGGSVTTPKRGLVDEPGSYAGEEVPSAINFTLDPKKVGKEGGYRLSIRKKNLVVDEIFSVNKYGSKEAALEAAQDAYKELSGTPIKKEMRIDATPLNKKIQKALIENFPDVDFDFDGYKYGISSYTKNKAPEYTDLFSRIRLFADDYGRGSFPTGENAKQNLFFNLYRSSQQEGSRWQLKSKKPKSWTDGGAWKKAKFIDTETGQEITFDNLKEYLGEDVYNKSVKTYENRNLLNNQRIKFKGKDVRLSTFLKDKFIENKTIERFGPNFTDEQFNQMFKKYKKWTPFNNNHQFGIKNNWWDTQITTASSNHKLNSLVSTLNSNIDDKTKKQTIKQIKDLPGGAQYVSADGTSLIGKQPKIKNVVQAAFKEVGAGRTFAANIKPGTSLHKLLMLNCNKGKAEGGRIGYGEAGIVEGATCSIEEAATNLAKDIEKNKEQIKKGNFKNIKGGKRLLQAGGAFFGWVDAPIEFAFALPYLMVGDIQGAKRATTFGLVGAGGNVRDELNPEAKQYVQNTDLLNKWFDKYSANVRLEKDLENKDMPQEKVDSINKQLAINQSDLEDIQTEYDKVAYDTELDLEKGRQDLIKDLQNQVKENLNIDLKFPLLTSPEEWAVGKQPGLDLEASEKRKVRDYPEIKNIRQFKDQMGEKYAGTEGFLFFKPGIFDKLSQLGPDYKENLYGDYIMGRREGKELEDLYSSLPPEYTSQLSTLEKEDLLYGLKRKLIAGQTTKQQLEDQGFDIQQIMSARPYASGGLASLTKTTPPKRGPNYQGLASLPKYGKQY